MKLNSSLNKYKEGNSYILNSSQSLSYINIIFIYVIYIFYIVLIYKTN